MSDCLKWFLLFISCIAGHVVGLHEPSHVQIESRNFSLFLTWLPHPENPPMVTYEVQYTDDDDDADRWTPVPTCENISITECDFTCALMTSWDLKHAVQVQTVSPSRSPWVKIQNIQYVFTVDPDPPSLIVTEEDGFITVDLFTKKPFCVPQSIFLTTLKYFVVIRRYNPEEVVHEQELDGSSITKKSLGYNGKYCVAAKTRYTTYTTKESKFSHPFCLNFTPKDGHHHTVIAVSLCSIIFGTAVIIGVLIWYRITVKSNMPEALDFSSNKYSQKDRCMSKEYSDIDYSIIIYSLIEQDSSTKCLPLNKHDGVNSYPITGQGYMERPTMQTSLLHSQEYFPSKSSSGSTCPNTSGSVTDISIKEQNHQIDDCFKEININVSEDVEIFSSTAIFENNPFVGPPILDPNAFVPFDTLCIGGNNDHMDYSDEESGNQSFTDSEDGLDSLSTDYKMSCSEYSSQSEKAHKDISSGYTQRTLYVI